MAPFSVASALARSLRPEMGPRDLDPKGLLRICRRLHGQSHRRSIHLYMHAYMCIVYTYKAYLSTVSVYLYLSRDLYLSVYLSIYLPHRA